MPKLQSIYKANYLHKLPKVYLTKAKVQRVSQADSNFKTRAYVNSVENCCKQLEGEFYKQSIDFSDVAALDQKIV